MAVFLILCDFRERLYSFVIEAPEVYTANWTSLVLTAAPVICDVQVPAGAAHNADVDRAAGVVRIVWKMLISPLDSPSRWRPEFVQSLKKWGVKQCEDTSC